MWGVYEELAEIHIIPCDKEGAIKDPHTINCFCYCNPECKEIGEDGRLIIVHNIEN